MDIIRPDYPESAQRARLTAFGAVPLFRKFLDDYEGKPLPDPEGIKNALMRLGVPAKDTAMAMARLLDSAEQAGLFRIAGNRTKMIRPSVADVDRARPTEPMDGSAEATAPQERAQTSSGRTFPKIIDGALDALPVERQWDEDELTEWLDFFERALRVHYRLPRGRRDPS